MVVLQSGMIGVRVDVSRKSDDTMKKNSHAILYLNGTKSSVGIYQIDPSLVYIFLLKSPRLLEVMRGARKNDQNSNSRSVPLG